MKTIFKCERCGYTRELLEQYIGKKIKCAACGFIQTLMQQVNNGDKAKIIEDTDEEYKICPFCSEKIKKEAKKCRYCREVIDKELRVAMKQEEEQKFIQRRIMIKSEASGAKGSLICGILGLITSWMLWGFILGPLAILLAISARKELKQYPMLKGKESARIGLILGIVSIIASILSIIILGIHFYDVVYTND